MSRKLDDLSPRFRPLAMMLLARLVEAKLAVLITFTLRTAEEQAEAVAAGNSKVEHSRHQDGDAIDIVPYTQFLLHGEKKLTWDTTDPVWNTIGQIGESIVMPDGSRLRWGGRFKPLNSIGVGWDPGHFEYLPPVSATTRVA